MSSKRKAESEEDVISFDEFEKREKNNSNTMGGIVSQQSNIEFMGNSSGIEVLVLSIKKEERTTNSSTRRLLLLDIKSGSQTNGKEAVNSITASSTELVCVCDVVTSLARNPNINYNPKRSAFPIKDLVEVPEELRKFNKVEKFYLPKGTKFSASSAMGYKDSSPGIGIFKCNLVCSSSVSEHKTTKKPTLHKNFSYSNLSSVVDIDEDERIALMSTLGLNMWNRMCATKGAGFPAGYKMDTLDYVSWYVPLTVAKESLVPIANRKVVDKEGNATIKLGLVNSQIAFSDGNSIRENNNYSESMKLKEGIEISIPVASFNLVVSSLVHHSGSIYNIQDKFQMFKTVDVTNKNVFIGHGIHEDTANLFVSFLEHVNSTAEVAYSHRVNPHTESTENSELTLISNVYVLNIHPDFRSLISKFGVMVSEEAVETMKDLKLMKLTNHTSMNQEDAKNMMNNSCSSTPLFLNGFPVIPSTKSKACTLFALISPKHMTDVMFKLNARTTDPTIKDKDIMRSLRDYKSKSDYQMFTDLNAFIKTNNIDNKDAYLKNRLKEPMGKDEVDTFFSPAPEGSVLVLSVPNSLVESLSETKDYSFETLLKGSKGWNNAERVPFTKNEITVHKKPMSIKKISGYEEWASRRSANSINDSFKDFESDFQFDFDENPE